MDMIERDKHGRFTSTHGMCNTRLYHIWAAMIERCLCQSNQNYLQYGAKGISVCDEWLKFIPFKDWALQSGYADNLTIDRINPKGNYEPSNCRWATYKEQARHLTNNINVSYKGETHCLSEWSEITGIKYSTLYARIVLNNWPVDEAIERPIRIIKGVKNYGKSKV